MRYLFAAAVAICVGAFGQPATAQDEGPAVPVQNASYHQPAFTNDHVMVLNVYIPPGRGSNYHTHSLDQIGVLVEAADQTGQVMGGPVTGPRRGTKGNVNYSADSQHHVTHRGSNVGETPFHNIVVALTKPGPEGLTPGVREVPGYTQRPGAGVAAHPRARPVGPCHHPEGAGHAHRGRGRRDRRKRSRRTRPFQSLQGRRFLLAGRRRDPRRPQCRNDSGRTGRVRA
jgi:hypothetical protein